MSKAILVIDMPSCCSKCMCYVLGESNNFCAATKFAIFNEDATPHHCPLKCQPNRKDVDWLADNAGWSCGWNDCLNEILSK